MIVKRTVEEVLSNVSFNIFERIKRFKAYGTIISSNQDLKKGSSIININELSSGGFVYMYMVYKIKDNLIYPRFKENVLFRREEYKAIDVKNAVVIIRADRTIIENLIENELSENIIKCHSPYDYILTKNFVL